MKSVALITRWLLITCATSVLSACGVPEKQHQAILSQQQEFQQKLDLERKKSADLERQISQDRLMQAQMDAAERERALREENRRLEKEKQKIEQQRKLQISELEKNKQKEIRNIEIKKKKEVEEIKKISELTKNKIKQRGENIRTAQMYLTDLEAKIAKSEIALLEAVKTVQAANFVDTTEARRGLDLQALKLQEFRAALPTLTHELERASADDNSTGLPVLIEKIDAITNRVSVVPDEAMKIAGDVVARQPGWPLLDKVSASDYPRLLNYYRKIQNDYRSLFHGTR